MVSTRIYNRQQRTYLLAKANLETAEEVQRDMERAYLAKQGITDEDGKPIDLIYCIEDQAMFDRCNLEFSELPEAKTNFQEILEARDLLKASENALIEYGLNMAPAKERDMLSNAVKTNYTLRIKLIDLVMKLDATTVRA